MSELKPCPFCGGQVKSWHTRDDFWNAGRASCTNDECYAHPAISAIDEPTAIKLWNTRYEPTCHNISRQNKPNPGEFMVGGHFECSACGFMYGFTELPYGHCPGCGAKVVSCTSD